MGAMSDQVLWFETLSQPLLWTPCGKQRCLLGMCKSVWTLLSMGLTDPTLTKDPFSGGGAHGEGLVAGWSGRFSLAGQ